MPIRFWVEAIVGSVHLKYFCGVYTEQFASRFGSVMELLHTPAASASSVHCDVSETCVQKPGSTTD